MSMITSCKSHILPHVNRHEFAVLSQDPQSLRGPELFDIDIDATILGGQMLFGA